MKAIIIYFSIILLLLCSCNSEKYLDYEQIPYGTEVDTTILLNADSVKCRCGLEKFKSENKYYYKCWGQAKFPVLEFTDFIIGAWNKGGIRTFRQGIWIEEYSASPYKIKVIGNYYYGEKDGIFKYFKEDGTSWKQEDYTLSQSQRKKLKNEFAKKQYW